jgi:hypothetical protein
MAQVVGVHGMAQQQRGRVQLLRVWEPALEDGIELARGRDAGLPSFALAFYGSVFLSEDAQGREVPKGIVAEDPAAGLGDVTVEELAFLDDAATEAIAPRPELGPTMGIGAVPRPLQPLAQRLSRHFDGALVLTFVQALRQVKLYLDDGELAARIRAVVLDTLAADSRVVLAHSLGTVVAFDVLNLNPDCRLDTLVTVGSPLSMRAVATRLRRRHERVGEWPPFPGNVRRWVNVYDPGDPVAAAGAVGRLWPAAEDYTVENENEPHAIDRYLGKRITGEAIATGTSP